MATKPAPPRPVPRLYLATPMVDDPAPLIASLPALLAGCDIAAVLLRLKPGDPRSMIARIWKARATSRGANEYVSYFCLSGKTAQLIAS